MMGAPLIISRYRFSLDDCWLNIHSASYLVEKVPGMCSLIVCHAFDFLIRSKCAWNHGTTVFQLRSAIQLADSGKFVDKKAWLKNGTRRLLYEIIYVKMTSANHPDNLTFPPKWGYWWRYFPNYFPSDFLPTLRADQIFRPYTKAKDECPDCTKSLTRQFYLYLVGLMSLPSHE